jgi:DNA-binding response OmpR family regulator
LLVDDEYDIISLVRMILKNTGFLVDAYTDPVLALSNFKVGLYDLLLLDIRMPEMDGLDLYQKMKQIDNNAKVCFITASELFYEEYRRMEVHP